MDREPGRCEACRAVLTGRSHRRFCSGPCRQRAYRARSGQGGRDADLIAATSWNWAVGDLVVEAMRRAMDGEPSGVAVWSVAPQRHAVRCGVVAVAFELVARRSDLSWAHHWAVWKLADDHRAEVLDKAAEDGLTARSVMRLAHPGRSSFPSLAGDPPLGFEPIMVVGPILASGLGLAGLESASVAELDAAAAWVRSIQPPGWLDQPLRQKARKHSDEFKLEAVAMVVEDGERIADVARRVGVGRGLLANWVRLGAP